MIGDIDVSSNALLTIKPGTTLLFAEGTDLEINQEGALKAVGTATQPILFSAVQKTKGYWEGINFYYSNNVKNELAHIVVEYGGGGSGWKGSIHVDSSEGSPSRVSIKNSVFKDGYKYGIWLDKYTISNDDIISSNTFIDNSSGNVGLVN